MGLSSPGVGLSGRRQRLGGGVGQIIGLMILRPESARSLRPASALVPSRRTTTGTCHADVFHRGDDAFGDQVAAHDAAEDVDQHGFDIVVAEDELERFGDPLGGGSAADVEEVGRLAAGEFDDVHGGHGQPGAVDHAADAAVQRDVVQAVLRWLGVSRSSSWLGSRRAARGRGGIGRCRRGSSWRPVPAVRRCR